MAYSNKQAATAVRRRWWGRDRGAVPDDAKIVEPPRGGRVSIERRAPPRRGGESLPARAGWRRHSRV